MFNLNLFMKRFIRFIPRITAIIILLTLLSFKQMNPFGTGYVFCDNLCKLKIEFHTDPIGDIQNPCANGESPYILVHFNQKDTCIHPPPGLKYLPNNYKGITSQFNF